MSLDNVYISYRHPQENSSKFLKVSDLQTKKLDEIKNIYLTIFSSISTYDPKSASTLRKVEQALYNRIVELTKDCTPEIKRTHEAFLMAFGQMERRALPKTALSMPKQLEALKRNQLSDPVAELARLKSIPRIAKVLSKIQGKMELTESQQIAFGRSLELQECLQKTHYVINHGQSMPLMVANMLTRVLKQLFEPENYPSEYIRHNELFNVAENLQTASAWQDKMRFASDQLYRTELISGDCRLDSMDYAESALYFFSKGTNMAIVENSAFLDELIIKVISHYIKDESIKLKLFNELKALIDLLPEGGNLYSICVPKEEFDNSCYFSSSFGTPVISYARSSYKSSLGAMQSCSYPHDEMLQVRVLAHKIRPEDGYLVILNSTLPDNDLKEIEDEVSLRVQAALTGYRVS